MLNFNHLLFQFPFNLFFLSENTTNRNEAMHKINMQLIEAEIKLLQADKTRTKATNYLFEMNEARKATEVKLIDAFEEIIMEAESRQLILAEQSKKKAEAMCVKAEKKHTDVEIGYLKIKDERREALEAYENDINKRHHLKTKSRKSSKSSDGSKETSKQSRKSPKDKKKSSSSSSSKPKKTPPTTPRIEISNLSVPNGQVADGTSNSRSPRTSPRVGKSTLPAVFETNDALNSTPPRLSSKNKTASPVASSKSK